MTEPTASVPIIEDVLGGYRLHWIEGDEESLLVEVKHIQADSRGMTGEVTVWHDFTREKPTLSGVRLNLLSEQRRTAIAKRLTAIHDGLPWDSVLEQVCHEVIERYRKGDPGDIIEPVDDDDMVVPQFILDPLILAGVPNVIYGDKGTSKTTLSILAAGCMFGPWPENPFGFGTNGSHHATALLDYESNKELTLYATQRLRRGTDVPYFELAYRHCKLPLADDVEQIAEFLAKRKVDVAIIDSMGAACGGDLFKPEPALKFFEALRAIKGMTWLIIAQNAKGEEGKKTIFGSTYFTYYSRNIFELRKYGEFDEKIESYVALTHTESNYSAKHDPMGFHLQFTPKSIKVEPTHVTMSQLMERAQVTPKIVDVMRETNTDMTLGELATATGVKITTLSVLLTKLKGQGKVVNTGRGKWGLRAQS
jgi:hypothetical protein